MLRVHDMLCKATVTAGLALSVCAPLAHAQANKERVLYSFTGGTDGAFPSPPLITDQTGNLYGTTQEGGITSGACAASSGGGCGVVFKLAPDGTLSVLYSFSGGNDGNYPVGGLIRDNAGNLYGTVDLGGISGGGAVYKLAPNGTLTVLYSFTGGADGGNPKGGVISDTQGNLYGTASQGGVGGGVVFKIDPAGQETVLYSFTNHAGDGFNPEAGLTMDAAGNLYGTTFNGGAAGSQGGIVFKVAPDGTETILHTFTGPDGHGPDGNLILDKAGNVFGTTQVGGSGGCGVVFKLTPKGKETVLYSFTCGSDGGHPDSSLIQDKGRSLYGTTSDFGAGTHGVVFQIAPSGAYSVLHAFAGGNDGFAPGHGLVMDNNDDLYGTTIFGGGSANPNCFSIGCGTIFKVKN